MEIKEVLTFGVQNASRGEAKANSRHNIWGSRIVSKGCGFRGHLDYDVGSFDSCHSGRVVFARLLRRDDSIILKGTYETEVNTFFRVGNFTMKQNRQSVKTGSRL